MEKSPKPALSLGSHMGAAHGGNPRAGVRRNSLVSGEGGVHCPVSAALFGPGFRFSLCSAVVAEGGHRPEAVHWEAGQAWRVTCFFNPTPQPVAAGRDWGRQASRAVTQSAQQRRLRRC